MKKVFFALLLILIFCVICIISIVTFSWDFNKETNQNIGEQHAEIPKEPEIEKEEEIPQSQPQSQLTPSTSYRLTSYWNGDGCGSGSCTGSGLCEQDFQINENGWYTYMDMLVLGAATPYLLNYGFPQVDGIIYRNYFDTIQITINGVDYNGIILDSCGACMSNQIIDLFVSNSDSGIATYNVTVK